MEPLLLVEDKTELRAMLRKALERNGFRVEEAPDGSAAIQKLRSKRYQMVVTDLKMPGASGLDVLRESKQADSTIPVILLTAFGSVEEAVAAMKEGAQASRRTRHTPTGVAPRKSDSSRRILGSLRIPPHRWRITGHESRQPATTTCRSDGLDCASPR
jgi:CheY-like chemotaxis protein